ncbi:MAG: metallophosphoesterase [Chitinispirillia bacterium]|nr:metallophosphoesterase [Chitinispirillia bacterium]
MIKRICIAIFAFAFLAGLYALIEPYLIEEKIYPISSPRIPVSFNGTRIVFITDIHHGPFFSRGRLKKLVDRVNGLEPDMLLFGGDYIHRNERYIMPCFEELSRLKAPLGMYGVLGNHDHRKNAQLTRDAMEMAGITLIDNAGVWVNRGESRIRVGGMSDVLTDWPDIDPAVDSVTADDFVTIVTHNPDVFAFVDEYKLSLVDLALCGHTHGWQINLPYRLTRRYKHLTSHSYNYKSGRYHIGENTNLIISRGIGTVFMPLRLRARPQIVIIYL